MGGIIMPQIDYNEIERRKNETPEQSAARLWEQLRREREALNLANGNKVYKSPLEQANQLADDDITPYEKSKYLVKEISTQNPGPGQFNYWDDDRIKAGFNYGNGTWEDMLRYMDDNKGLAKFEIIRGGK